MLGWYFRLIHPEATIHVSSWSAATSRRLEWRPWGIIEKKFSFFFKSSNKMLSMYTFRQWKRSFWKIKNLFDCPRRIWVTFTAVTVTSSSVDTGFRLPKPKLMQRMKTTTLRMIFNASSISGREEMPRIWGGSLLRSACRKSLNLFSAANLKYIHDLFIRFISIWTHISHSGGADEATARKFKVFSTFSPQICHSSGETKSDQRRWLDSSYRVFPSPKLWLNAMHQMHPDPNRFCIA